MVELEEIVKVHAAMVRRIATVYERYPDRVDDLVQEVWIAVWQALPRLNDPATLKSYIARITQNICVTHVRRALVWQTQPLTDTCPIRPHLLMKQPPMPCTWPASSRQCAASLRTSRQ